MRYSIAVASRVHSWSVTSTMLCARLCFPSEGSLAFHCACTGMFAGAVQTLVSTPVDLLKIRQQLQLVPPGSPCYVGPLQLLSSILRHEGLAGERAASLQLPKD